MDTKLTLRLQDDDVRALARAAEIIGGPRGAPFVTRTTAIRRALAAFNGQDRGTVESAR